VKLARIVLIPFLIVLLLSANSMKASQTAIWGEYENSYVYEYNKESTTYDEYGKSWGTELTEDTYHFFNITTEENYFKYRTSEVYVALEFIKCPTIDCYNQTLYSRFNYDPETETVEMGILLNITDKSLFTTDATLRHYGNFFDYSIPLDIMEIFWTNYYWLGIFGLFLPPESENFQFRKDYSNYINEYNFTTFTCNYETEFRYRGERYSGHLFDVNFTGGVYFGYLVTFENHEFSYKYSNNGVLYEFYDQGEIYSNYSGRIHLEKEYSWQIELITRGSTKLVDQSILFFLVNILIIYVVIKKRQKKIS
jgi:hypothetical protein